MQDNANPTTAISVRDEIGAVSNAASPDDYTESEHANTEDVIGGDGTASSLRGFKLAALISVVFILGGVIGGLIGWIISDGNNQEDISAQKLAEIEGKLDELMRDDYIEEEDGSFTSHDGKSNETDGGDTGSSPPATGPPIMSQSELKALLSNVSPDKGMAFDDPESPQSLAFQWLLTDIEDQEYGYSETQLVQRYVLATLYYSTTGEGWTNNLGFLSNSSECSWEVSNGYIPTWYGKMRRLDNHDNACNDAGSITSLSLTSNDLSGTLPNELSLLTELRTFQFRGESSIFGSLPTELGALTKLQLFAVEGTQITGKIPSEIGQMRLLDFLDLSNNVHTGNIPTDLGSLESLQYFDIHGNKGISGQVPVELGGMKNASKLFVMLMQRRYATEH